MHVRDEVICSEKFKPMKKIICVALMLISIYVKAGSCSANGTGNWETPGNWSCGHVPGAGDDVTIGSKIDLAASSVVNIYSGGGITGGNSGAKLVFPSASYSGPFATAGPYYFSNGGSGNGLLALTLASFYSS